MLVWSNSGRRLIWLIAALLIGVVYLLPLATIMLASLSDEWNGILPGKFTLDHYVHAMSEDSGAEIRVSIITGAVASLLALVSGTWAALALRSWQGTARRVMDLAFFIPSAVPSVSVGLGLLVAFSRPPILLNGTIAIVIVVHFVLVSAFTFGNVSAGLVRLGPEYEQMAQSLGARPGYCLRHVTLPMVLPQLAAAVSLSFALSMGELGATIMVYPPGWVTLPVGIFSLTDRGDIFDAAALTIMLAAVMLGALYLVFLISSHGKTRQ